MAAAALAAQADVRAETVDQPRVAAARMGAPEPDDVAEEQLEGLRIGASGGSGYQSRGLAVDRDERPVGRRQLEAVHRRDGDDDVGLGRGQLGDDPAGPGQRAGQLLRRADRVERRTGRRASAPSTARGAGRSDRDDARDEPHAADGDRLGAGVAQLVDQVLETRRRRSDR